MTSSDRGWPGPEGLGLLLVVGVAYSARQHKLAPRQNEHGPESERIWRLMVGRATVAQSWVREKECTTTNWKNSAKNIMVIVEFSSRQVFPNMGGCTLSKDLRGCVRLWL